MRLARLVGHSQTKLPAPAHLTRASQWRRSSQSGLGVIGESYVRRLGSQVFDEVGCGHERIGKHLSALQQDARDHASPKFCKEDTATRNPCRIELSQSRNRRQVRTRRRANRHWIGQAPIVGTHDSYLLGPGDGDAEVCLRRS
jgi:hypothetical protein